MRKVSIDCKQIIFKKRWDFYYSGISPRRERFSIFSLLFNCPWTKLVSTLSWEGPDHTELEKSKNFLSTEMCLDNDATGWKEPGSLSHPQMKETLCQPTWDITSTVMVLSHWDMGSCLSWQHVVIILTHNDDFKVHQTNFACIRNQRASQYILNSKW